MVPQDDYSRDINHHLLENLPCSLPVESTRGVRFIIEHTKRIYGFFALTLLSVLLFHEILLGTSTLSLLLIITHFLLITTSRDRGV